MSDAPRIEGEEDALRYVGLDLPPRDATAAYAWCDARVERLLRALSGDLETPLALTGEEDREYVDMDRGQEWPARTKSRTYRLGALEARPRYDWSHDGWVRDSFALTILRLEGEWPRPIVGLSLRVAHVAVPTGPESWCAVRYGGSDADLLAVVRFFLAEAP